MKKFFLFLALLAGGAGTTWAQFTWTNSSTAITTETWASSDNWTCASGTTFPTAGAGPMTTNSNAWVMVNLTGCSGSVADLEGWNPKMTLDATTLTVENMRKMQGGDKNFTLKNGSTLTITLGASNSGNDGGTVPVTFSGNGNTFNLKLARNKGGDVTTVNYGTVTDATTDKFNVSSSASGTAHTYNSLTLKATLADEVTSTTTNTLHSVVLGNISSDITVTTLTYDITAENFTKTDGVLTATDDYVGNYSVVKSDNGDVTLYWVTGPTEKTITATGTFTTWSYHAATSGAWYGKTVTTTDPVVTLEEATTADVIGWSTSNKVKRPWLKAGYTYNITAAIPAGKVITGYTLTTQSTSSGYTGTYTYTTADGTATSEAQAVNTDKTVTVTGLNTQQIVITLGGTAGSSNYGILVTGLTITYDDAPPTYLYRLKHNTSGLYLLLNETDGYNGSSNDKNAATFSTSGTEFLMKKSGDNYIFRTTTGKTLNGACSGKEWNFSNTTENSTNTEWKVTEVTGGVTIQPVAGSYSGKYVGNVSTTISEGDYVYTNQDDANQIWNLEKGSKAPSQVTITFNYKYNGTTVKSQNVIYTLNSTYTSPDLRGYSITAQTGTATEDASVDVECTPYITYKYVYIANDNDTKLQASDESGTLTMATTDNRVAEKYIWKVTLTSDGYYNFQNLATGKYMKHKGVQDAAYNFELRTGLATGNYAIYSVADSRYFVIKYDGTLDQATGTYNKSTTNFSTDFIFEEAVINTLTISTTPAVAGVFTWNGVTKRGSNVTFSKIAGITVTDKSVTAFDNGYTASLSASEWDGESDLTITATMTSSFFSTNYGDKWVRISSAVNSNYVMSAGAETTNMATTSTDVTADSQLFCFVGNATDGFKIYSKAKGSSVALYTADTNSGTAPSWTEVGSTWYLDSKYLSAASNPGYGLTTQDVTTTSDRNSLNLWGGTTGQAKFWSNGSSNGGSRWYVNEVAPLTLTIACTGTKSETNQLVGSFSYTADGVTSSTNVTYASLDKSSTMYLPVAKTLTVNESSFVTYPGYEVVSQSYADNTLTVNYKATDARWLFQTYGHGRPYRIPAIAKAKNGDLIAVSDDRYCGNDIGYGRVDLVYKVSHDNGATWGDETMLAQGDGESSSNTCGFGDAAIVADRTGDKVMVMCVSAPNGGTCWTAAQRSSIMWGTPNEDGTWTWTTPVDIKDEIMALLPADRVNYFVGSGKLHQSRYIKVGNYYRVYAALWTTAGSDLQNYVVYSDEFGAAGSWKLLGTTDVCPGPNGNEPKCEELPNGSVLLSARQPYHRLHNIFTYTDAAKGEGAWSTSATGINNNDSQGTDGEILIVNARRVSDGKVVQMGLQSSPNNGRAKLSIWYKDLSTDNAYDTPANFGSGWTLGKQITAYSSAYSTMIKQADGKLGFYYEDGQSGAGYDMIYMPLTLEELTNNQYSFSAELGGGSTPTAPALEGSVESAEAVTTVIEATANTVDLTKTKISTVTIEDIKSAVDTKTENSNTLVYAPTGTTVTTAENVVVDGICQKLNLTDGKAFTALTEFTATTATYERTMPTADGETNHNTYGTICLPYAVASGDGVTYYTITDMASDKLSLEEQTTLAAGTPAIFCNENASLTASALDALVTAKIELPELKSSDYELSMNGCYTETTVTDENAYYIKNNKFWQRAEATAEVTDPYFTVAPFRAYLTLETTNPVKCYSLGIEEDGNETAISALTGEGNVKVEGIYRLNGAKQPRLQKGTNILQLSNGRTTKVLVK